MLELTKSYGPMLTIIFTMIEDLSVFLILWVLLLLVFTSSGFILFNELAAYNSIWDVFVVHFEASLGNWALKIYKDLSLTEECGEIFHMISVTINLILMLNLVIAILSETYARLAPQRLGLYYDGLIANMPSYLFDKRYGIMILLPPPFNIFCIPYFLVFICLLNKPQTAAKLNKAATMLSYFPLALLFCCGFIVLNILLVPIAYVKGVFHKVSEITRGCCRKTQNAQGHKDLSH
jgi:hypothetical protein